jgi:hypothetical protein
MSTKFDNLYEKIMCECKSYNVIKEDAEQEYQETVKELFTRILDEEACDLAELVFTSNAEKQDYITDAAIEYIDDIEEHIEGEYEPEEFMNLSYDEQCDLVKAAIADNSEAIFGVDIFA